MNLEEDKILLENINSDPQQFGVLFDLHYKKIFRYIMRRTLDYDLSHDIAAETFTKAFLNISRFKINNVPILYWLYRIATNELNTYFRKQKYIPSSLDLLLEKESFDVKNHESYEEEKQKLEEELKHYEDFIIIQSKLRLLPEKYQEVIALRFFEDKSIKEISKILNKREGTIKSLLSRGLEKLRHLL